MPSIGPAATARVRTAALIAAAMLALTAPGQAGYDPTADFLAATPACDTRPDAAWIGHVGGTSSNNEVHDHRSISFVGCFETLADCEAWRSRAVAVIVENLRIDVCAPRRPGDD